MPEYRPIGREFRDRFEAILRHAFALEQGPDRSTAQASESAGRTGPEIDDETDDVTDDPTADEWPPALYEARGLLDDGELVSVCGRYTFDATLRGEWTTIGGLAGVATPPERRGRGYARSLLRAALEEYREDGVALVTLWPASVPFYRAMGWATANRYAECDLPPSALEDVERVAFDGDALDSRALDGETQDTRAFDANGSPASGEIRQLGVDDWERLRVVEERRAERASLSIRRSEAWWRERTLAAWPDGPAPYLYGYERDGDLLGYVYYTVESDGSEPAGTDGPLLTVGDLAAVDRSVERELLAFLANHDSQVRTIRLRGRIADDLLDVGPDPDELECTIESGPMVRLTDVPTALERADWSGAPDATVRVAVTDPLLDHSADSGSVDDASSEAAADVVLVAIEDGDAVVTADGTETVRADDTEPVTGDDTEQVTADDSEQVTANDNATAPADGERTAEVAGTETATVDLTTDVSTLSQLVVGTTDLQRAERLGHVDVRSEPARRAFQAAFPSERVCLREFF